MNEFKGTKGKWFISEIGEPNKHNNNTGCHVFSVEGSDDCGFIEMWFGDNFQCSSRNEALYNAQLVAHAPEMFEMLRRCYEAFKNINQPFIADDIEKLIREATTI